MNTETQMQTPSLDLHRPAVDLFADDARFVWLVDLPGIGADEVELELVDGKLAVEATSESLSLKYVRRLQLPEEADSSQVDASLEQGQLRIEIQKREELKPRKIAIAGA
jgi:HSP20 family protein